MNGSSQFCFHRDHSRMSKRHQEPALVFRELKPKCCFVLARFQVFEVQGTEFWKPQAALGFGSSHTDSEEQCLEKCECPLCLGTVLSACPWRPLGVTKGPRKLTSTVSFLQLLTHLSPFWDLKYADDTVLLSNSAQQITRFLHLLQREAGVRGLTLNLDKCALLRLHSDSRIPFSPSLLSPCDCSHCSGTHAAPSLVPLSDEVKYLGVFLDASSNNRRNLSHRISQAISASKFLKPLLGHKSLPPSWKLTVYRSVVQSILVYAMENAELTPPQLTRIDHVHFKSIRRIFGITSSFLHSVLNPTGEECSNQYLVGLAYNSRRVRPLLKCIPRTVSLY